MEGNKPTRIFTRRKRPNREVSPSFLIVTQMKGYRKPDRSFGRSERRRVDVAFTVRSKLFVSYFCVTHMQCVSS